MSDPTTPADQQPAEKATTTGTTDAADDTTELAAVKEELAAPPVKESAEEINNRFWGRKRRRGRADEPSVTAAMSTVSESDVNLVEPHTKTPNTSVGSETEKVEPAGTENVEAAETAEKPVASDVESPDTLVGAETKATEKVAADGTAAGAADKPAEAVGKKWWRRVRGRDVLVVVGGLVVVVGVLAALWFVWGVGPVSKLYTSRAIHPPAKIAGLDRVTDKSIRDQLQVEQIRQALKRINDGKDASVEAYGTLDGNRMFLVIAMRGRLDVNKTIADSGVAPDKIKHVGKSTCIETNDNLPTQCYRSSNTLTVITQSANEGVPVDQVEPIAEEAFNAMK
ncbi:hypothetical protein [Kribbella sp. NPDC055071]